MASNTNWRQLQATSYRDQLGGSLTMSKESEPIKSEEEKIHFFPVRDLKN